jgi:DNA-binding NtrC family response regulator
MNIEKKRRIVTLVHDQELRSLLNDFIPDGKYELESARDGLDGFHKLAKTYFDLIITDFRLPGLGGVNLLPRLKRIQPWARVLVIPTAGVNRGQRRVIESEADVCLEKPFQVEQLKTVIQKILSLGEAKSLPEGETWGPGRWSMETT